MVTNEKGQSTIEFLMTFVISISFLFFFVKMAINYTNGYLVHYANYMASRAYLVRDSGKAPAATFNDSVNKAKEVFGKYNIAAFMPNFNGNLSANNPATGIASLYVGTFVEYDEVLSLSKIVGGKKPIILRSESFLGKEPVKQDCEQRICRVLSGLTSAACENHSTKFDNGC